MPRISEFYGIIITLYYGDHLPAHFHALYGGQEAVVSIEDGTVLRGGLPPRATKLVAEWYALHALDLALAWQRAQSHQAPGRIDPLP